MARAYINRYVVCVETDRPHMKRAGKIHYEYEAMPRRAMAEQRVALLKEQNKNNPNKKIYFVDQDKNPEHVFVETDWANP